MLQGLLHPNLLLPRGSAAFPHIPGVPLLHLPRASAPLCPLPSAGHRQALSIFLGQQIPPMGELGSDTGTLQGCRGSCQQSCPHSQVPHITAPCGTQRALPFMSPEMPWLMRSSQDPAHFHRGNATPA